jgi:PIN domain nuclease of toxin-antitoxin system
LDTCALQWMAEGSPKLSSAARAIIDAASSDGAVSVVSLWELSMKSVVGKLQMPLTPAQLGGLAERQGLELLPLTVAHVDRFHKLPPIHRDPFDRLLIAVALDGGLAIISPDSGLDNFGVTRVW